MVTLLMLLFFSFLHPSLSEKQVKPSFAFSWSDDNNTFKAGGLATIKIKLLGDFDKQQYAPLNLTLTVNQKVGNSCYISGLSSNYETWTLSFTPILIGVFNVLITDDALGLLDSSLLFYVNPGHVYASACVASWSDPVTEFIAGAKATVFVLPRDAFGNNISSTTEETNIFNFTISAFYTDGMLAIIPNITYMGWNKFGYFSIDFIASKAGNLLLHVEEGNRTLNGCPLPFKVFPGPLDVSNCEAEWNFGTNSLQIFSKMEIFIHQKDEYGNLVPGLYPFDALFIEKRTNLAIPMAELHFEEVEPGIQLFSSSMFEPGDFFLNIFDMRQNKTIFNMPYEFTVFVGYCDGLNSVINGSGLENSVAGEVAKFSVYLNDRYQYPSPVEVQRLRVQITREVDSYAVLPSIAPLVTINGGRLVGNRSFGALNAFEPSPAPSVDLNNTSGGALKEEASAFEVMYTPEKSGIYGIHVYCGNIPLNNNRLLKKDVRAGVVDLVRSGVIKLELKVPKQTKNEIVVHLLDSFDNPVTLQKQRLKLEFGSINSSGFQAWEFEDRNNGSYVGYYLAKDVGTYDLCASFDGNNFLPCPFNINVYSNEYFPRANTDTISVWEDESIAFDALANDIFAGDNATILETSQPVHGSLLQENQLFRYTPYKGFFGNDSFMYTISDVNNNLATAAVYVSVLSIPPQFISFPSGLQATEDMMSPQFGGFPGFTLRYSDLMENISVTLSAQSGTVFLSPMLMQFGQPMWTGLSVTRNDGESKDLILQGFVEVINSALNSIQYLGYGDRTIARNENFCGEDTIRLSTMNKNGINELRIPVLVEPINDPPYIHVPAYIILKSHGDEALIFDRKRDKFEFSIGDPDVLHFPGGESHFTVIFSMEVNSGFLVASLPAMLINTTELKLKSSYQWQPLQTFVSISKHFIVKAKGIRFVGTIEDCNTVMQQLIYNDEEHGAVLTLTLNDLGNYGCYPGCTENISMPLLAEATVSIIRRSPMSSMEAHTLRTAIIIESSMVFCIGMVLLFYTCKCAIVLSNEKRSSEMRSIVEVEQSANPTDIITGQCSSPVLLSDNQPLNIRQRSRRRSGNIESSEEAYCSAQSSTCDLQTHQQTPPSFVPFALELELK